MDMYIYAFLRNRTYICTHTFICTCTHIHIYMNKHTHICKHIYTYICKYTHRQCTYVHIHKHHTQTEFFSRSLIEFSINNLGLGKNTTPFHVNYFKYGLKFWHTGKLEDLIWTVRSLKWDRIKCPTFSKNRTQVKNEIKFDFKDK